MALTAEQIAEARKEGYSDAEILKHYAAAQGVDLKAAYDEGYSDSEILSHFSGADVAPQEEYPTPQDSDALANPKLSAALGAGAGAVYSAKTIPVKAAKALGSAIGARLQPPPEISAPKPQMYTTPAGINVEQTPGGLHPGAVGNAQFNVEQQQANKLHQAVPEGFEVKGTSRIITPVGMEEPAAALGGAPRGTQSTSTVNRLRKEGWPIVRETTTQAAKAAAPVVGGALRGVATSNPVAGAMAGYNLQDALNRYREGDTTGATIGGLGVGASVLPKMKGKLGLIKPLVGLGAAGINALRGQPEGYKEGGLTKKDLALQGLKTLRNVIGDIPKGYLHHTEIKPNEFVGTRFETKDLGGLMPVKPMSVESLKGKMVNANPWDDTSRNVQVLSVSGKPLLNPVTTHGGHAYARDIEHAKKGIAGASGEAIAKRVQARADLASREGLNFGGTGEVVTLPSTMGKFSGNFAFPTTELYYDYFKQAEMPKRMIKELSDTLAARPGQSKGYYEAATHLNDPDIMEAFKQNSDFRKAFLEEMQKKKYQKILDINAEDAANAMADPHLIGIPRGYVGHTAIGMKPGAEITPSSNISYSHNTAGEYLGSLPHTPIQVMLNRPYEKAYQEMAAKYPDKSPAAINQMAVGALETRGSGISELMDEQAINRIGQYHEGISQGKFDPYDVNAALDYLKTPGIYKEGGEVKHMAGGKLTGGLATLPKDQQAELQKLEHGYNRFANQPTYQKAEMIGEALSDVPELAASFHPGYGLGYAGGALYDAIANTGDYGNAAVQTAFNAPGVLKPIGAGIKAAAPMLRQAMPVVGGLGALGAADAAEAGQGSKLKQIIGGVMDQYAPKAEKAIVPGAPHTYGPQATGPWMRDYQPAQRSAAALDDRAYWDQLAAQHRAAQNKVDYSMGRTGPTQPQPIQYMGKYLSPTPERMAAEKAQRDDAIRSAIENRKAQWLKRSREMGMSEEDIAAEMNSPWGAPWMP